MAEFPYVLVTNSLKRFLQHLKGAGIPSRLTSKYLEGAGFKSTNDRAIIGTLKSIGFVDSSGVPTDRWKEFRSTTGGKAVLATAIQEAYADLFNPYPDAYRRDTEALRNYFSTHTKVGEKALVSIVQTFKALCEMADFEGAPAEALPKVPKEVSAVTKGPSSSPTGMTINLNIQLSLPATEDATIYNKIFEAMKKHLLTSIS